MASPNVDFYKRQKDLTDQMSQCERERIQLEKQFKLLMQSDQNSAQLKATKLQTYWKKICADEKRAQQRNTMLMREFERIDSHMASMTARTQRLNFLKQQYADYVARTYPEWTRTVEHKMKRETEQDQPKTHTAADSTKRSQEWTEAEKEDYHHPQPQHHQQQQKQSPSPQNQHQQQQQYQRQSGQQRMAQLSRDESIAGDDSSGNRAAPMSQPVQSVSVQRVTTSAKMTGQGDSVTKTPAAPRSSASSNVGSVRATAFTSQQQQQLQQRQQAKIAAQQMQHGELDSPGSEYMNISQFSNKNAADAPSLQHTGQGDQAMKSPTDEGDSDFGTDNDDLPLSNASPVKAPSRRQGMQSRHDSMGSLRSSGSLMGELTMEGLIRLLRHIEADIKSGNQGVEYYGSPILRAEEKIDLIQRANSGGAMQGLSGTTASHLVLEQMTNVVRSLPEQCLISDQLLSQQGTIVTAATIGASLTEDAQELWAAVFTHFNHLIDASVMQPKEIAGIFVPCLVADRSPYLDKAFSLLANLLEGDDATDASSIASPRQQASQLGTANSNSLMEDGRVPPLKFGSLVDKPFSDEESSFFDQSMPKEPAVPLNETSAYKQMLSGTFSRSLQKQTTPTSDDTDDDVEKEFANVLSPKSVQTKQLSPALAVQPTSEPDSPSEVEPRTPGPKSPVYVPTAVEHKSLFGSTSSSQGQRRAGGIRLGSDFETDSEAELAVFGSSKRMAEEEDKDDFDFYGA